MKKCQNGHFYSEELDACPYCPKPEGNSAGQDKTVISGQQTSGDTNFKTKIFGSGTPSNSNIGSVGSKKRDLNKTYIDLGESESETGEVSESMRASRKLVGWLVSYTIDKMGRDFRLYEGKNKIGAASDCEITIPNDPSVSSVHSTILFRNDKFKIKDEFSTNGTYLNEVDIDDVVKDINDGDTIKIGKTIFKFKVAL